MANKSLQSIRLADFYGQPLQIVDHHGQPWLTAEQIGVALGLKHARTGTRRVYDRHVDEFTDDMTTVVKLTTVTGDKETRIFSPRGAWLIAMFCQTEKAKAFRRWVLDVLEKETHPQKGVAELCNQLAACHAELAKLKPLWGKIAHYRSLGLNNVEIGLLIRRGRESVRRNSHRAESCGLMIAQDPPQLSLRLEDVGP